MTPSPSRQALIRDLNDGVRADRPTGAGRWVFTRGVSALGADLVACALAKVRAFDRFEEDNDPHGEHDFGAFEYKRWKIFWKIDYYDPTLREGSPAPENIAVTRRVITVMLAEEY